MLSEPRNNRPWVALSRVLASSGRGGEFTQPRAHSLAELCTCSESRPHTTVLVLRMVHRNWKETKQHPSMLPGPAVPGCSLVYFHILWAILSTSTVDIHISKAIPGMEFLSHLNGIKWHKTEMVDKYPRNLFMCGTSASSASFLLGQLFCSTHKKVARRFLYHFRVGFRLEHFG